MNNPGTEIFFAMYVVVCGLTLATVIGTGIWILGRSLLIKIYGPPKPRRPVEPPRGFEVIETSREPNDRRR